MWESDTSQGVSLRWLPQQRKRMRGRRLDRFGEMRGGHDNGMLRSDGRLVRLSVSDLHTDPDPCPGGWGSSPFHGRCAAPGSLHGNPPPYSEREFESRQRLCNGAATHTTQFHKGVHANKKADNANPCPALAETCGR